MKLFRLITLAALMLMPTVALAQTATPAPLFSFSSQAIAIHLNGQTSAGTDVVGALSVTKSVLLQSDNILVPNLNLQGYYGGVRYNFNLDKIIAKTNIPKQTFQPYVHGAFGVVRNVPANGASTQHYSGLAGAGFDYDPNRSGRFSFGPRVEYVNAPGFGSSPSGIVLSANLTFVLAQK